MRIRTLMWAVVLASMLMGAVALAVIAAAARAENVAGDAQSRAQFAAHEITGLLTLAQEYARYLEPRAAEQWHQRQRSIATVLASELRLADNNNVLAELRNVTQALPELFSRLEEIPKTTDAFDLRRREALLDQLLTSTQAMSDYADRWFQGAAAARRQAVRQFQVVAIVTPALMLAMFVIAALVVRQRVLAPVQKLAVAAAAVSKGELSFRVDSEAADELGELARQFDGMVAALDASGTQAHRSAKQLRAIADNLPVLIAYVDRDEIYRFTNAQYRVVYGVEPASFIGTTMEDSLGPVAYAELRGEIEAVLLGERRQFERHGTQRHRFDCGVYTHVVVDYIPDVDPQGKVDGFYIMVTDVSARHNAELARLRSEKLLRMITDSLPTLIAYIDRDQCYRFANEQYRRLPGVDPEKLVGRTVEAGLGAETYAVLAPYLVAALAGERQQFERISLIDGTPSWLLADYIPDLDEHGVVVGLYAMTADITERRHSEARLRDSEQRLRAITDNIPAMIGHFDAQERCTFANMQVLAVNGLTKADIPHHTLRSGIGEDAYAIHEPYVKAVLRGEACNFEGHLHRRGSDVYVQAHLVPDRADDGSTRGFYIMSFDVTAVRKAELARARSEERLRKITDNLPVLIAYIDREQRIGFANNTYRTWLGIDAASMTGKPAREVLGHELYDQRIGKLSLALNGERVEFESELAGLGVTRIVQTCYIPDVDGSGSVLGVYALTTDVTSLKEVEQQLQALARFDTLTGLPNRLHYNEKLPQALARAGRTGTGMALMFLDIDHFKHINDSFGHAAGDAVLKEFAQRLKKSVRLTDTVVRLAGDEFVVILEGVHQPSEAEGVAVKVISEMTRPFEIDHHMLTVTTSVGISFHDASASETTPGELLDRADKALYQAKGAGRNAHRSA